jgi:hypothetical protein
MAAEWTLTGIEKMFDSFFRGATAPTNLFVALCTEDDVPDQETVNLSQLTEIAAGNGYTAGGFSLDRNSTDFDVLTANITDRRMELQIKDVQWTASGGAIPSSGGGAKYAVLTDDDPVDPRIYLWWELTGTSGISVPSGSYIKLEDFELRGID